MTRLFVMLFGVSVTVALGKDAEAAAQAGLEGDEAACDFSGVPGAVWWGKPAPARQCEPGRARDQ